MAKLSLRDLNDLWADTLALREKVHDVFRLSDLFQQTTKKKENE